jgi:Flp pilus assembly protein TadG
VCTRLGDEGGQAALEFALVLPLLLAVVMMVAQVATVYRQYLTLTDAVRAGARVAVVSRTVTDPTGTAKTAVTQAGSDIGLTAADVSVTSTWAAGSSVTVSASRSYTISIIGLPIKTGVLQSSTTERVE